MINNKNENPDSIKTLIERCDPGLIQRMIEWCLGETFKRIENKTLLPQQVSMLRSLSQTCCSFKQKIAAFVIQDIT